MDNTTFQSSENISLLKIKQIFKNQIKIKRQMQLRFKIQIKINQIILCKNFKAKRIQQLKNKTINKMEVFKQIKVNNKKYY
jgi:hypothetical protein